MDIMKVGITHVVQAWAMTISRPTQPDLARQFVERSANVCPINAIATAGDEQIRRH